MKKLKENGYKIALCSGRPLLMAKELDVFNHVEWDGFMVAPVIPYMMKT